MTDDKRDDQEALVRLIAEPPVLMVGRTEGTSHLREAVHAASRRGKPLVIIGTSGSADYLRGANDDRRFWPVKVQVGQPSGNERSRGDLPLTEAARRDDVDEEME